MLDHFWKSFIEQNITVSGWIDLHNAGTSNELLVWVFNIFDLIKYNLLINKLNSKLALVNGILTIILSHLLRLIRLLMRFDLDLSGLATYRTLWYIKCLIFSLTFKVLLFNTNKSIQHYSFFCTQLNNSRYCYVSLTIQLNISRLFAHS